VNLQKKNSLAMVVVVYFDRVEQMDDVVMVDDVFVVMMIMGSLNRKIKTNKNF
jgi:hypothetical protein